MTHAKVFLLGLYSNP